MNEFLVTFASGKKKNTFKEKKKIREIAKLKKIEGVARG